MKNIFDWLKQINYIKSPVKSFSDKDWEIWNSYMIHRFLSMNPNFLEVVNFVQDYPPQEKQKIYSIYKEFIPKNNKWNKYIKSNTKEPNKELVEVLTKYFSCSKKEAKEYIYLLDKQDISRILTSIGLDKKEITKLI
jgi:hypothetical protein